MATILVVDDSAVERQLVGGILTIDGGWTVQVAKNGCEALALVEKSAPDAVVTDVMMPEMDGLELVVVLKERFPRVPVILVPSQGQGEIAERAVRLGAVTYSPSCLICRGDLVETVRTVLIASRRQSRHGRRMNGLTASTFKLVLENDPRLIPKVVGYLRDEYTRLGLCDEWDCMRLAMALSEALAYAIFHGNLELSSDLRASDQLTYAALALTRSRTPPYSDRRIYVEAELSIAEGHFRIRHAGPGFDPYRLPDADAGTDRGDLGGRGLLLIRSFMDEVFFNDAGNEISMTKRRAIRAPAHHEPQCC